MTYNCCCKCIKQHRVYFCHIFVILPSIAAFKCIKSNWMLFVLTLLIFSIVLKTPVLNAEIQSIKLGVIYYTDQCYFKCWSAVNQIGFSLFLLFVTVLIITLNALHKNVCYFCVIYCCFQYKECNVNLCFRSTSLVIYFLSALGMLAFTFTLDLGRIWIVFVTAGGLGWVMFDE